VCRGIYIYIYIRIYVYTYIYAYIYIYMHIYICIYVYIGIHIHTYIHTCMHIHIQSLPGSMYICIYLCVRVSVRVCVCVCMCVYTPLTWFKLQRPIRQMSQQFQRRYVIFHQAPFICSLLLPISSPPPTKATPSTVPNTTSEDFGGKMRHRVTAITAITAITAGDTILWVCWCDGSECCEAGGVGLKIFEDGSRGYLQWRQGILNHYEKCPGHAPCL